MPPSDPTITAAAELPIRDYPADFMGWYLNSTASSYMPKNCDVDYNFIEIPTYVACEPVDATSNAIATSCGGGILTYPVPPSGTRTTTSTFKYACTSDSLNTPFCITMYLMDYMGAPNTKTGYDCGSTAIKIFYYRERPSTTNSTPSTTNSTPYPPDPPPDPLPSDDDPPKSKAWIAGVVIGPVVGLALIGAIVYLLLRRRRNNRTATGQTGSASMGNLIAPNGVGGDIEAKSGPHNSEAKPELHVMEAQHELHNHAGFPTKSTRNSHYLHGVTPTISVAPSPAQEISPAPQIPLLRSQSPLSHPPHTPELSQTQYAAPADEIQRHD